MVICMRKKWLQVTILMGIVVIGGFVVISGLLNGEKALAEGDVAPDFSLTNLEGQVVSLSDYSGQPIMLNFWGTFCEPCVIEMPLFEEYYKQYEDLVVLGVNLDEPPLTVRRFVNDLKLTFPILLDKTIVSKQYDVRRYPTTFFINRDGVIEHKVVMLLDEQRLAPLVAQLLQ